MSPNRAHSSHMRSRESAASPTLKLNSGSGGVATGDADVLIWFIPLVVRSGWRCAAHKERLRRSRSPTLTYPRFTDARSETASYTFTMQALELKVPPPVVAALVGASMWVMSKLAPAIAEPEFVRTVTALAVALAGAALTIAGVLSFRQARTTVNPMKPEATALLVRSGVYSVSRNPCTRVFLWYSSPGPPFWPRPGQCWVPWPMRSTSTDLKLRRRNGSCRPSSARATRSTNPGRASGCKDRLCALIAACALNGLPNECDPVSSTRGRWRVLCRIRRQGEFRTA